MLVIVFAPVRPASQRKWILWLFKHFKFIYRIIYFVYRERWAERKFMLSFGFSWSPLQCASAPNLKPKIKRQFPFMALNYKENPFHLIWIGISTSWNSPLNSHLNPNIADSTIIFYDNKNQHQMQRHRHVMESSRLLRQYHIVCTALPPPECGQIKAILHLTNKYKY